LVNPFVFIVIKLELFLIAKQISFLKFLVSNIENLSKYPAVLKEIKIN